MAVARVVYDFETIDGESTFGGFQKGASSGP